MSDKFPAVKVFLTKGDQEFSTEVKGGESFENACARLAQEKGVAGGFVFKDLKSSQNAQDSWVAVRFTAK